MDIPRAKAAATNSKTGPSRNRHVTAAFRVTLVTQSDRARPNELPTPTNNADPGEAGAAARAEVALRYNFISCLILTAQNGFGQDVDHVTALCRETWGEHQLGGTR